MTPCPADTSSHTKPGACVIGTYINAIDCNVAIDRILVWGKSKESRTVCLCNVHSAVTARSDHQLSAALESSDLVLPDGAPIAWVLRKKGFPHQRRVAGPDLMLALCAELENKDTSVFLFGSDQHNLTQLERNLNKAFPRLKTVGTLSPRFGVWSTTEECGYIEAINNSGCGIVFVGLGCPRQEIWIAKNKNNIHAVMLGVGAAFDFHADTIHRAPPFMRRLGLEWLHRFLSEPRRLWKRYLFTNTRFLLFACRDLYTR